MTFENIDWADSDLRKIEIEYDIATLHIWNDTLEKMVQIICTGLAGVTSICIWDDTDILAAEIITVHSSKDEFIEKIYNAYDKNYNYGGKTLSDGLLELKIELSNHIPLSVYCLKIDIVVAE